MLKILFYKRSCERAMFQDLGTPNEKIWNGVSELKGWKTVTWADYPYNRLRDRLGPNITDKGFDVINR